MSSLKRVTNLGNLLPARGMKVASLNIFRVEIKNDLNDRGIELQ